MEQSPSWEANNPQEVKKFTAFYGIRRFVTPFTRARHWSLSWDRCMQSTYSHPISLGCIIILSSHLRLGIPSGLFPSDFPTKLLYASFYSPMRATCPAYLIILHLITLTIFGEAYKLRRISLCSLLLPPATSFLKGPNILLRTLFSNTLNRCSSFSVRDYVSHPIRNKR